MGSSHLSSMSTLLEDLTLPDDSSSIEECISYFFHRISLPQEDKMKKFLLHRLVSLKQFPLILSDFGNELRLLITGWDINLLFAQNNVVELTSIFYPYHREYFKTLAITKYNRDYLFLSFSNYKSYDILDTLTLDNLFPEVQHLESHPIKLSVSSPLDDDGFKNAYFNLIDKLYKKSKKILGSDVSVIPYGSMVSGLTLEGSDIDLVVLVDDKVALKAFYEVSLSECKKHFIKSLSYSFRHDKEFRIECIASARVPICRLHYEPLNSIYKINADVSFCSNVPRYNSMLMKSYADFDPRARTLLLLVKKWAKSRGLNDASLGSFSSYAWCILTIYFLQRRPGGSVLPSLQNPFNRKIERFDVLHGVEHSELINVAFLNGELLSEDEKDDLFPPSRPRDKSSSVTQLLVEFFLFYGLQFDIFGTCVNISPALDDDVRPLQHFAHGPKFCFKPNAKKFLAVLDPFEPSRVIGATDKYHSQIVFEFLRGLFVMCFFIKDVQSKTKKTSDSKLSLQDKCLSRLMLQKKKGRFSLPPPVDWSSVLCFLSCFSIDKFRPNTTIFPNINTRNIGSGIYQIINMCCDHDWKTTIEMYPPSIQDIIIEGANLAHNKSTSVASDPTLPILKTSLSRNEIISTQTPNKPTQIEKPADHKLKTETVQLSEPRNQSNEHHQPPHADRKREKANKPKSDNEILILQQNPQSIKAQISKDTNNDQARINNQSQPKYLSKSEKRMARKQKLQADQSMPLLPLEPSSAIPLTSNNEKKKKNDDVNNNKNNNKNENNKNNENKNENNKNNNKNENNKNNNKKENNKNNNKKENNKNNKINNKKNINKNEPTFEQSLNHPIPMILTKNKKHNINIAEKPLVNAENK